jgi:hypothetical protein
MGRTEYCGLGQGGHLMRLLGSCIRNMPCQADILPMVGPLQCIIAMVCSDNTVYGIKGIRAM